MNDLLGNVRGPATPGYSNGEDRDLEAGSPPPPSTAVDSSEAAMEGFFKDVAIIKGLMSDIRTHQGRLQDAHEKSKTVTKSAEMHQLREQMQAEITAVSRAADIIKRNLANLDEANAAALKKKNCGHGSASERTRTAITGALRKKLKDLMGEFQELRARVNSEYREVVERRVYTVTGQHADDATIDDLIEKGEGEQIFQKAILEQGRGHVLDTLAEIRERRDAVQELERSLMELHQVFLDMAVLVEAQGSMLDNIQAQVGNDDFIKREEEMCTLLFLFLYKG